LLSDLLRGGDIAIEVSEVAQTVLGVKIETAFVRQHLLPLTLSDHLHLLECLIHLP